MNARQRLEVRDLGQNFSVVHVHYGFMQSPNIPVALRLLGETDDSIDLEHVTYFVGHETIVPSQDAFFLRRWREKLFAVLNRNALRATAFYKLPPEKVVELGMQIEI